MVGGLCWSRATVSRQQMGIKGCSVCLPPMLTAVALLDLLSRRSMEPDLLSVKPPRKGSC